MKRLALVLACAALLPGCSTVRGWLGISGPETDAAADAAVAQSAADAAREREAVAANRSARERDIRQQIRKLEADAKSGAVPLPQARKRIDALKAELETVVSAESDARGSVGTAKRGGGVDARLDRIEARLDEIERRLGQMTR